MLAALYVPLEFRVNACTTPANRGTSEGESVPETRSGPVLVNIRLPRASFNVSRNETDRRSYYSVTNAPKYYRAFDSASSQARG